MIKYIRNTEQDRFDKLCLFVKLVQGHFLKSIIQFKKNENLLTIKANDQIFISKNLRTVGVGHIYNACYTSLSRNRLHPLYPIMTNII